MPNIFVVDNERFEMKYLRQYSSAVLDKHIHGIETGSPCPPQSPLAVAIIPYPIIWPKASRWAPVPTKPPTIFLGTGGGGGKFDGVKPARS